MSGKRVNPRRTPATQADVDRAHDNGVMFGTEAAMAIMLTVLVDKFNGADYICDVWHEVIDLSESVGKGYVTIPDLKNTLKQDYGINFTEGEK